MKTTTRISILISISLLMALASCKKDKNYPEESILGSWLCQEQGTTGYRQYNVLIDNKGGDTTMIVIVNLYNSGWDIEVEALVTDTLITLLGSNYPIQHDFSGEGHIERDFSAIYLIYNYFGQSSNEQNIEAVFRRP